jgi:roadblock/LC7 domain-containing protein
MKSKKVTKKSVKPAKKAASKKAVAMNIIKHKRVVLELVGTESLPEMVFVSAAPAWAKAIVGKRYVSLDRAKATIEALDAEKLISKGAKNLLKEMDAAGITPLDVDNI